MAQLKRGQQVNSVFGEGVNPRLRKLRDGLDELGLSSDELLNHGGPRLVYGVPLAHNFREYLLGLDAAALLPSAAQGRGRDARDGAVVGRALVVATDRQGRRVGTPAAAHTGTPDPARAARAAAAD